MDHNRLIFLRNELVALETKQEELSFQLIEAEGTDYDKIEMELTEIEEDINRINLELGVEEEEQISSEELMLSKWIYS
jgi:hypothetical protein